MAKSIVVAIALALSVGISGSPAAAADQSSAAPAWHSGLRAAPVRMTPPWAGKAHVRTAPDDLSADVVVYGDSITVATHRGLEARIRLARPGYRVRTDAQSSIPTSPSVARFAEYLSRRAAAGTGRPAVVLMALGSNDTLSNSWAGPAKVRSQVEEVRRLMGDEGRLIWVDVYTHSISPKARALGVTIANAQRVNAAVLAARDPRTGGPAISKVVSWYRFIAGSAYRQKAYLSDGVHTTALGGDARNALIAAAL